MPYKEYRVRHLETGATRYISGSSLEKALEIFQLEPDQWVEYKPQEKTSQQDQAD